MKLPVKNSNAIPPLFRVSYTDRSGQRQFSANWSFRLPRENGIQPAPVSAAKMAAHMEHLAKEAKAPAKVASIKDRQARKAV